MWCPCTRYGDQWGVGYIKGVMAGRWQPTLTMQAPCIIPSLASFKHLWAHPAIRTGRESAFNIVKVDRTDTAREALPSFIQAVEATRGAPDVHAVTMMNVGLVVRLADGARATRKNVDLVMFATLPGTIFLTNEDVVSYILQDPTVDLERASRGKAHSQGVA